jgi:hypothetical protein
MFLVRRTKGAPARAGVCRPGKGDRIRALKRVSRDQRLPLTRSKGEKISPLSIAYPKPRSGAAPGGLAFRPAGRRCVRDGRIRAFLQAAVLALRSDQNRHDQYDLAGDADQDGDRAKHWSG